jgi:hypothetical protein
MWRLIIIALLSVAVAFAFIGCEGKKEEPKKEVKNTEPPKPPEPPKPKPFDPVAKWVGTLDGKPWTIEITKDEKDPAKLMAKGYTDLKVEGDKITFMAKKVAYEGMWDGIKEELTIKWKEKDKDMSVVVKKEMAPPPTTEPVKKEEPKKEEPKK